MAKDTPPPNDPTFHSKVRRATHKLNFFDETTALAATSIGVFCLLSGYTMPGRILTTYGIVAYMISQDMI